VVAEKARSLIKKWVEDECKKDNSLSLVESLYKELLDQGKKGLLIKNGLIFKGYSFETDPTSTKKKTMISTDPNVVVNDQEEADIAKG
jgi:exopolysaccharide biosynthesis protein